jgi:hypothetical protein
MSARAKLRLRLRAAEYLIEATDSCEGDERDDLIFRAKNLISRADGLTGYSIAGNGGEDEDLSEPPGSPTALAAPNVAGASA